MMKKRWKQVMCILLSLVLIGGSVITVKPQSVEAATKNYVKNGGFESESLPAGYNNATVVKDKAHSGDRSAKVNVGADFCFSSDGGPSGDCIPANTACTLSAWVYAESEAEVKVWTSFWKSDWSQIDGMSNVKENTITVPANQWTKIDLILPTWNCDSIIQPHYGGTQDFYIDDITLHVSSEYDFDLSFKEIDDGKNWMFNRSGVDTSVGQYFYFDAFVDGVSQHLWLEFTGEYTYIYSGVFSSAPTKSFRIPEGTAFTQYQSDGQGGLDKVNDGNTLYLQDTLYVVKGENGWEEQEYKVELGLTFSKVGDDGIWWIAADITADNLKDYSQYGVYYQAQIYVDGEERTGWFEIADGYCFMYSHFFGGSAPKFTLEILKDTVLYEATGFSQGKKENGRTLTVKDDLYVTTQTAIELKPTEMSQEENSWYLNLENSATVTGSYYKATILVDGKKQTVPVEKSANGMVIWSNFFNMIENGKTVPKSSIEIKQGTKLYPIDPNNTGWSTVIAGDYYAISDSIRYVKDGDTWKKDDSGQTEQPEQPEQPTQSENLKLTFESIFGEALNFQFAWEMSDGATPQNGFYRAEAVIDGTSSKVLIEFTENYFWIYPHCFSETPGSASQYPTATFSIAEGTTLTPVSSSTWSEDSSRKSYKLSVKVDMAYTDGEWTDVGNQGGTVVEKDPISLKIFYNRMVGESFAFDWELSGESKPEAGFYRTDAVIDGKSTKICMEYFPNDNFFFIYQHCFNDVPSDTDTQYPTKSVYIAKGATLTPIKTGSWAKDVNGQPYTLNTKVDLVLSDGTWMDADYKAKIDNMTPLKVNIVFSNISGSAMIFKVVTSNGKSISDIYGDWTTAVGELKKGTLDEATKKYTYEKSQAFYSITGETFYVDSLGLSKLDGIQIEEGTILYPDGTCKSDIPIQIVNRVRVIRDSEDEWVVDTTYTTYTTYTEVSNSTTQTTTDSSSNADNQESDAKENGTTDADVVNTDYAAGNIVFADKTTSGTSYVYKEQNDSAPVVLLTVSGSMCGVIAVLLVVLGLKKRKRQAS